MATYVKKIICLANSRKISGRCLAGKELIGEKVGQWIRPISARPAGELSEDERRYVDGTDPKLLDIADVPMSEPKPHSFQTENHVIDSGKHWTRVRRATAEELEAALDTIDGPLWENQSSSTYGNLDRVEELAAAKYDNSLKLIRANDLEICVGVEGAEFGNAKRRVRGSFSLNGSSYLLSITDPTIERQYLLGADGRYKIGNAILSISLGDVYQGYAYKLIAGVIL